MSGTSPPVAFLLSAPRSGSTLLLRMLHAHPQIQGLAEPHLIASLPGAAQASPRERRGLKQFLETLPDGQGAQIEACRAYLDTLYSAALRAAPTEATLVVDKTPANARRVDLLRAGMCATSLLTRMGAGPGF